MRPWWLRREEWVAMRIALGVSARAMLDGCDREEAYCRGIDASNAYLRRARAEAIDATAVLPRLRGWWWRKRNEFRLGYRSGLGARSAGERLPEQRDRFGV